MNTSISAIEVDELGGPQLVELFNQLGPPRGLAPVKKFADLAAGRRRVKALVVATAVEPPKVVKAEAAPRKAGERAAHKKRGNRYVFPYKAVVKKVKGGTDRGKLLALISTKRGHTDAELLAATWCDPAHIAKEKRKLNPESRAKACYEAIRLLQFYCGYGMEEDEHKRVHLRKNPPAPIAAFLKEQGYVIEKDVYPYLP